MALESIVRWAKRENKDADPLEFYRKNYDGFTRSQLQEKDKALYEILRRRDLLHKIPRKIAKARDFGSPLDYYQEHYPGMTREELREKDKGLYNRLQRDSLLDHIPKGKERRSSKYGEDALAYYKKHYLGLTRGELAQKDVGLYKRIREEGLLKYIPRKYRNFGNPLSYYKKHYPKLTRGKLRKKDKALYRRLRKDGLLKEVSLAKNWQKRFRNALQKYLDTSDRKPTLEELAQNYHLNSDELREYFESQGINF
ncbi:hypothetical protein B6U80_02465 [Candidatus Pacearchaeota archaeon ex4484_26]|nr:MAG: hypothetical protein B6U80_02465 [Candidatus Pacearchaeota archaeon ex4484_26]